MFIIDITVNDTSVLALCDAAEAAIAPPSLHRFLEDDAFDWLRQRTKLRFMAAGDGSSGKWLPLSPATEELRIALGYGPSPINERSGDLLNWLLQSKNVSSGGVAATLTYPDTPPTEELAQKLETAQKGRADNPIPNFGPTPARPVVSMDEDDLFNILRLFAVHFANQLQFGLS